MKKYYQKLIDNNTDDKVGNVGVELSVSGLLMILFGGIIVYTELAYPFKTIRIAYSESIENFSNVNWQLLLIDYRTSLVGCVFSILGGILLIRESRIGWVLSLPIGLSYLIIYSLQFVVNISNERHHAIVFLILMICILLLTSLILGFKKIRDSLKIGRVEVITFIVITVVFLQQYYR